MRTLFVLSANRKRRSMARRANYSRLSGSNHRHCCVVARLSDSPSRKKLADELLDEDEQ
jgi:hypothetical protein